MLKTGTNLNFPILEVAYIHQIMYNDPLNPGEYHLDVSLLLDINGQEVVCELSGNVDQLMDIIDPNERVSIMVQEGNVTRCVGETRFTDLLEDHFKDVLEYLEEGNNLHDMARLYMERMTAKEIGEIRNSIRRDKEILADRT